MRKAYVAIMLIMMVCAALMRAMGSSRNEVPAELPPLEEQSVVHAQSLRQAAKVIAEPPLPSEEVARDENAAREGFREEQEEEVQKSIEASNAAAAVPVAEGSGASEQQPAAAETPSTAEKPASADTPAAATSSGTGKKWTREELVAAVLDTPPADGLVHNKIPWDKTRDELWHPDDPCNKVMCCEPFWFMHPPKDVFVYPNRSAAIPHIKPQLMRAWKSVEYPSKNDTRLRPIPVFNEGDAAPIDRTKCPKRHALIGFAPNVENSIYVYLRTFQRVADPCTRLHLFVKKPPADIVYNVSQYKQDRNIIFEDYPSHVKMVPRLDYRQPEMVRHLALGIWLRAHMDDYDYIIQTDTKDVVFFADPFTNFTRLYASQLPDEFCFVLYEEYAIRDYPWSNWWWITAIGEQRILDFMQEWVRLRGHPMYGMAINSGVYGGTPRAIVDYVAALEVTMDLAPKNDAFGFDQGAAILLAYLGFTYANYPHTFVLLNPQNAPYRHQYQIVSKFMFHNHGESFAKVDSEGNHLNCVGNKYSFVHQMNRHERFWNPLIEAMSPEKLFGVCKGATQTADARYVEPASARRPIYAFHVPKWVEKESRFDTYKKYQVHDHAADIIAAARVLVHSTEEGKGSPSNTQPPKDNFDEQNEWKRKLRVLPHGPDQTLSDQLKADLKMPKKLCEKIVDPSAQVKKFKDTWADRFKDKKPPEQCPTAADANIVLAVHGNPVASQRLMKSFIAHAEPCDFMLWLSAPEPAATHPKFIYIDDIKPSGDVLKIWSEVVCHFSFLKGTMLLMEWNHKVLFTAPPFLVHRDVDAYLKTQGVPSAAGKRDFLFLGRYPFFIAGDINANNDRGFIGFAFRGEVVEWVEHRKVEEYANPALLQRIVGGTVGALEDWFYLFELCRAIGRKLTPSNMDPGMPTLIASMAAPLSHYPHPLLVVDDVNGVIRNHYRSGESTGTRSTKNPAVFENCRGEPYSLYYDPSEQTASEVAKLYENVNLTAQ